MWLVVCLSLMISTVSSQQICIITNELCTCPSATGNCRQMCGCDSCPCPTPAPLSCSSINSCSTCASQSACWWCSFPTSGNSYCSGTSSCSSGGTSIGNAGQCPTPPAPGGGGDISLCRRFPTALRLAPAKQCLPVQSVRSGVQPQGSSGNLREQAQYLLLSRVLVCLWVIICSMQRCDFTWRQLSRIWTCAQRPDMQYAFLHAGIP